MTDFDCIVSRMIILNPKNKQISLRESVGVLVIGYSDFHDADPMVRILLPVYLELYFLLCLELQLLT
jgi:hypothetical protein